MGSLPADCMSSLEQIRQQAAGSSVERCAPHCHRRDDWEESSITAFVDPFREGDEQLMTAVLRHWGTSGPLSWAADSGSRRDSDCVIRTEAKRRVFWKRGGRGGGVGVRATKCAMTDVSFSDCCCLVQLRAVGLGGEPLWLDCIALPPHCAGAREGEGKQEIYVLLWHMLL